LGVIANGTLEDVPVQWRHYLLSDYGMPQVVVSVGVDQSLLDRFADADRPIVDSLELLPLETASALKQPAVKRQ
jgi:hypothetical protein